jgi:hypothetical protein
VGSLTSLLRNNLKKALIVENNKEPNTGMPIDPMSAVNDISETLPIEVEHILEDTPIELSIPAYVEPPINTPAAFEKPVAEPVPDAPKNVTQEMEVFVPYDTPITNNDVELAIPGDTIGNIQEALSKLPNVDIGETTDGVEWARVVDAAPYSVAKNGWFGKTVAREGSNFRQGVKSERGVLGAGVPKIGESADGVLTGNRAVLHVRGVLGLGSVVKIPLWHSGFWITLRAPSDGEMLELNRRLDDEKIRLGRETYGLAFANNSVFFVSALMEFALTNVYATSLKPELMESIRSRISALDIPIIAWGLACVVWPRGFPYARAVMDQVTEQNKVIREKLNLGKCHWTDNSALTPWQIAHMAGSNGNVMTAASLDKYKDEFTRGKGRTVKLAEDVDILLRVPNLDQYLNSGHKWVNNIVAMVDRVLGMNPNDNVRDKYIMDQGKATNMRQFAHWVEAVVVKGSTINDIDTVEQVLDSLTAKDSARDEYFKGIRAFIEDSTISIVAIPASEQEDKSPLPRFPLLLPLDALSVFFILLVQRAQVILNRI